MSKKPHADPGEDCPLWKMDVSEVCHKCPWYTLLRGKHPQTGADIDDWACAIAWIPIIQIEEGRHVESLGAAIESFRNEMVEQNKMSLALQLPQQQPGKR